MKTKALITGCAILALAFTAPAAEYFVNKQGGDGNDGQSRKTAFLTVQKGVDALQPGDTLTIGPGEYAESVKKVNLGSPDAETIIRAELPGTAVLRGDVPVDSAAFKKVDGYRHVYAADFDGTAQGVNEVDTMTQMTPRPTIEELEYAHGSSHYDAKNKRLYISTSDAQPPQEHHYTVSVIRGSGLLLLNPKRATVDGLAATGFQTGELLPYSPEHFTRWGIFMNEARQCVIRNCTAWFNGAGLGIQSTPQKAVPRKEVTRDGAGMVSATEDKDDNGWNLIEKCHAFANGSQFTQEGGNILVFASNHDEIRDCHSYLGTPNSLRHYGAGIRGPAVMKNNIAWGGSYTDIFIKGGEADKYGLTENCITLGITHSKNVKHSIIGSSNQYNPTPGKDVIYGLYSQWGDPLTREDNLNEWFADARNLDFRLQPASPFRGIAPDGADAGPFPYEATIFYVSKRGSDNNDGLSINTSWKTLTHAVPKLRPGDTLYIEGGAYDIEGELKINNAEGKTTSIRGRGNKPVIVRGDLQVASSRGLEFERLNFTGALTLADSRDLVFNNCRFSTGGTAIQAMAVQNLKITHCEFTGFTDAALALQKSRDIWLSGNLFDNIHALAVMLDGLDAVQYSDYNAYSRADNAWRIAKTAMDLAKLQNRHDQHSRVQAAQFKMENEMPMLENAGAFAAGGPHGSRIGFHRAYQQRRMNISEPHVHSVSDTTADLEWVTPVPAVTTLAWGEAADTPDKIIVDGRAGLTPDGFASLSLTGLKPATTYYYRLLGSKPMAQQVSQYTQPARSDKTVHSFTTAPAPAAERTLYVAPDGNDASDGLSREKAWKTVSRAADEARAGDTVLIAGGVYYGTAHVRSSGTPGRPITFKAMPGEKVIFDGKKRTTEIAFSIMGKEHINLDGFYFRDFAGTGWVGPVHLRLSKHIRVERCFFNGYGAGTPGLFLCADTCEDVLIRNNVITRGFQGMYFADMKNLRIENNVFLNNLIAPILNSGGGPGDIVIKNNIFVDSIPSKVQVWLFEFGGFDQYVMEDNALYLRVPDEERQALGFYGGGKPPFRMSFAAYEKKTGQANLVVDDPRFAITEGKEPMDSKGNKVEFLGDWIPRADLDFPDLFTLHPELQKRKIGLLPEELGFR